MGAPAATLPTTGILSAGASTSGAPGPPLTVMARVLPSALVMSPADSSPFR